MEVNSENTEASIQDGEERDDSTQRGRFRLSLKLVSLGFSILIIGGFVVLLAIGLANREPPTGRSGITRINKPAPNFTLPLFQSADELNLADHLGQPIVINFWASWCVPCRQEAPIFESLSQAYQEDDVLFIGVDIQDAESDSLAYLEEFGITYPNGLDSDGRITVDYGVIGIPVTFFINREGIVERRWVGAVRESQLIIWIDELVAGVAPTGETEAQNLEDFRSLN